jgi:hypothetical protein
VELTGFQTKPELNGQRGTVKGFVAKAGSYKVKLDQSGLCKIKPENLKRIANVLSDAQDVKEFGKGASADVWEALEKDQEAE